MIMKVKRSSEILCDATYHKIGMAVAALLTSIEISHCVKVTSALRVYTSNAATAGP